MDASHDRQLAAAVEVTNLTHRFGDRAVLSDLSFAVGTGSTLAILGPNGSGKTTLFRILATLLKPTAGRASILGADIQERPAEVRTKLGVVFQHPSLDGKLTVLENLRHHGRLYGIHSADLRARMDAALVRFELSDRRRDRVERLSGGLRRRVELAKVMLHRPTVLLLDEPSAGLDPAVRRTLFDCLSECRSRDNVTTLLTTHLMDEADRCDVVAVLDEGRMVAFDTPSALKSRVGGDVVIISVAVPGDFKKRLEQRFSVSAVAVGGALHVERARGHEFIPQLVEAFPGEIDSVTVGKPTLEDVFLRLTGRSLQSDFAESKR